MLTNDDLYSIKAGATNYGLITFLISGITFIIGIIDGYIRPLKCN